MSQDFKSDAIIIRRVDYGEADRIIDFLTPKGRVSAIAKSVRKEKSRLRGALEPFSFSEIVIHQKSSLGVLTAARLKTFYGANLLQNYADFEFAAKVAKEIAKQSEGISDTSEYFSLLHQILSYLPKTPHKTAVSQWYKINLSRISGDTPNFYRDVSGASLDPAQTYHWNSLERAFEPGGNITADHIKILRLMSTSPLKTVLQVANLEQYLVDINL